MLATATHDTKRGEDARARLNVLSELVEEWNRSVSRWARHNASHRTAVDGEPAPDRNDEYLFYQTLLGAWPADAPADTIPDEVVQRVREYMTKATKEAKVHTSWVNPNEPYDAAVIRFVDKTLTGPRAGKFLALFLPFQRRIARLGMINSLAQVVLKVVSPGVPDVYQGTELWDLSLVDPDNRRPVDYVRRAKALEELGANLLETSGAAPVADLLHTWEDGRIKLYLTACGLRLRRRLPQVLREGEYFALEAAGEQQEHVVAVARRYEDQWVLAIVPRLVGGLLATDQQLPTGAETWQATRVLLPAELSVRAFRNPFTGERNEAVEEGGDRVIRIAEVLRTCPVAVLLPEHQ